MRFLGLGLEDRVPDAKTVWLYREQLTQAGVIETLFETFDGHLKDQGYLAMGGQIIDASIVAVPKQRNSRKENAGIKAGETPWQDKPANKRMSRRGGPRSTAGAITATRTMSTWTVGTSWCGAIKRRGDARQ